MTRFPGARAAMAALIAPLLIYAGLIYAGLASPASAMQILDAVDHGELAAAIAAGEVSRIAVAGDRVKKVIRAPDGLEVEHDAASGDLYLTSAGVAHDGEAASLFIVTEKGFTYRLTLTSARDGCGPDPDPQPGGDAQRGCGRTGYPHRRARGSGARGGAPRARRRLRDRSRIRERRPAALCWSRPGAARASPPMWSMRAMWATPPSSPRASASPPPRPGWRRPAPGRRADASRWW